ncbi:MAG: amidohydrolase family protein [Planctomycetota bacterium]|jgi:predicted TIM-barrel fold metal-dependent hydrolase
MSRTRRPRSRRRRRRRLLIAALVLLVGFVASIPFLIDVLGGAFTHRPDEMRENMSTDARALVDRAFAGIARHRLLDYHTHLVGIGAGGTGCFVHPGMRSWWHVTRRVQFEIYRSSAGIKDLQYADAQYVGRLVDQIRNIKGHGRHLLLALDKHYTPAGEPELDKTEFYTPNDYVFQVAYNDPDRFVPAVSVHPYRKDAIAELERCAQRGARIVKWIPNAMGIDPAHAVCVPFYEKMKELGMVLLSHCGEEKAVHSEEDQRLGNPLRLRRPLDVGVTVIAAHCASLGTNPDLDDPARPERENFDLFLRLMDEERYEGRLLGEISAITQINRVPRPLRTMLQRTDLHDRLVNGSDYPLPAINVLISTRTLVKDGFLTEYERRLLNEIYDYNPLLFDFVLKRTVRGPGGERFPPSVFMEHPRARATAR